ncbi:MAG TPA: hypothetical protein VKF17_16760 [Isosphaeraceae bacterium]|nr:hypothetical protein [Isosphaeraceae bacterium]
MGWVTLDGGQHVLIGPGDNVLATRSQIKKAARSKTETVIAKAKKEKAHPVRGEMKEARREGKGEDAKLIMADGSEPPSHVPAGRVSPAWTHVKVSTDPKAELLAEGRDEMGRRVSVTTKSYEARAAVIKFGRTEEMLRQHEKISSEIQAARNGPRKEEAEAAWLMEIQATRPGSEHDTKAAVKAYGATTLEARHVVKSKDGVRLQFVGKKGVEHDHLVRDAELAETLLKRKSAAAGPTSKIFNTNAEKVRDFVAARDGGLFTSKDFRTHAATKMALEEVAANPTPAKTMREYKQRIGAVEKKVSDLLGNKPAQARKSYILPTVYAKWMPA